MSDKTIDEHITMLRSYKKLMWGTECDKRYGESFSVAIDTMRKYQKIEQILDDCLLDDSEILQIVKGIVNE